MSLFCENNNNIKSREIKIDCFNDFTYLDKKYKLKFIKNLYHKKYIIVKLYKLYEYEITNTYNFIKDVVCKIIYKSTIDDNTNNEEYDNDYIDFFYAEIEYHLFLENHMKNFQSNVLFYYINNKNNKNLKEYAIFFDYLGETLEKFDTRKLDFTNKIKLVLDLLEQCIELNKLSLYHSDIKPENICIQRINENTNQDINKSEYKLSLIDFGILYGEKEYFNLCDYNTTITLGSPEYYDINYGMNKKNKLFPKNIFDKSQHFAVAGIIFGIFVNNTNLYFNEVCKIIFNKSEYSNLTFNKDDNILFRFAPFKNPIIIESIKNFILSSKILEDFKEEYDFIKNILINMLDTNYNKRLTFEELKIYFENKLKEFI
jgi:hypothetical protein